MNIEQTARILEAADPNRAHLEFDRLRKLATLRHYQALAKMADAQRDSRAAQQAKAAAHYGALAQEAAK